MDIIGDSVILAYADDIVVLQGRRKKKLFKQPFWYSTNGSIIEINFDTSITITYSKMRYSKYLYSTSIVQQSDYLLFSF